MKSVPGKQHYDKYPYLLCYMQAKASAFGGLEKTQRERKDLTNCGSSELSFK